MSKSGGVLSGEEALETGVSIAKKSGKAVAQAASDAAKAAGSQITGISKDTQDVVNHLYGKSEEKNEGVKELKSQSSDNQTEDNSPEEIEKKKKLAELRQQLHNEVYYDPLVNPKKPQEERPAEKVEKEKQQEMVNLQKKEEKKPPPLVQRTRERVEKYPGASG